MQALLKASRRKLLKNTKQDNTRRNTAESINFNISGPGPFNQTFLGSNAGICKGRPYEIAAHRANFNIGRTDGSLGSSKKAVCLDSVNF